MMNHTVRSTTAGDVHGRDKEENEYESLHLSPRKEKEISPENAGHRAAGPYHGDGRKRGRRRTGPRRRPGRSRCRTARNLRCPAASSTLLPKIQRYSMFPSHMKNPAVQEHGGEDSKYVVRQQIKVRPEGDKEILGHKGVRAYQAALQSSGKRKGP